MRLALLFFLSLIIGAPLGAQSSADTSQATSRYSTIDDCVVTGDGTPDEDWVAYKCEGYGGIPVWLSYTDSARLYLGFGAIENHSGPFGLNRDDRWPVEWRGVEQNGRFKPSAIIIRMKRPDAGQPNSEAGLLFVYKLRSDGLSCLIASDLTSNHAAREIADELDSKDLCSSEPHQPNSS